LLLCISGNTFADTPLSSDQPKPNLTSNNQESSKLCLSALLNNIQNYFSPYGDSWKYKMGVQENLIAFVIPLPAILLGIH
jgi:hypothetical protein